MWKFYATVFNSVFTNLLQYSSLLGESEASVLSFTVILQSSKKPVCPREVKYSNKFAWICATPLSAFLLLSL